MAAFFQPEEVAKVASRAKEKTSEAVIKLRTNFGKRCEAEQAIPRKLDDGSNFGGRFADDLSSGNDGADGIESAADPGSTNDIGES